MNSLYISVKNIMRLSYDHDAIFLLLSDPAQLDQRISSFLKKQPRCFIHSQKVPFQTISWSFIQH